MAGSLAKIQVLIVDDSPHIRRLATSMLRSYGCTSLTEAKSMQQALDLLSRKTFDIALIDWMLEDPKETGMHLVREIRQSPVEHIAYLPIIMMTGHTERDNIERARDAGITEFLAKPFTAKNLHARLVALIDQPRPFVKTRNYFGPDRRRREDAPAGGKERRLRPARREKKT